MHRGLDVPAETWANEDSGGFFAVSLTRRPRGTAIRASASSLCTALALKLMGGYHF
jgi:hypothetical protein